MKEAEGNNAPAVALPQWQSHKKVYGDKIKKIVDHGPNSELSSPQASGIFWFLECGGYVDVKKDLIARGSPVVGDYYVKYADGYESWSPAAAFEEGYSRI